MAENLTIARPYAEAVFSSAEANGTLAVWSQALQRLAMVVSDPDMYNAIGDPKVGPEQLYGLVAAGTGNTLRRRSAELCASADRERSSSSAARDCNVVRSIEERA